MVARQQKKPDKKLWVLKNQIQQEDDHLEQDIIAKIQDQELKQGTGHAELGKKILQLGKVNN